MYSQSDEISVLKELEIKIFFAPQLLGVEF